MRPQLIKGIYTSKTVRRTHYQSSKLLSHNVHRSNNPRWASSDRKMTQNWISGYKQNQGHCDFCHHRLCVDKFDYKREDTRYTSKKRDRDLKNNLRWDLKTLIN